MNYLSVRGFAKQIGVSDVAVREAIQKGRLVESIRPNAEHGWPEVELEIGKREWTDNRDPMAGLAMELNGNSVEESESNAEDDELEGKNVTFAQRRAEREKWAAKMAQIAYEERAGTLVQAAVVRKESFNLGRRIRDAMMNIPDRVATELAAELDATKVHNRLVEEITIALRGVVDGTASA